MVHLMFRVQCSTGRPGHAQLYKLLVWSLAHCTVGSLGLQGLGGLRLVFWGLRFRVSLGFRVYDACIGPHSLNILSSNAKWHQNYTHLGKIASRLTHPKPEPYTLNLQTCGPKLPKPELEGVTLWSHV